jgi:hypothetical protein
MKKNKGPSKLYAHSCQVEVNLHISVQDASHSHRRNSVRSSQQEGDEWIADSRNKPDNITPLIPSRSLVQTRDVRHETEVGYHDCRYNQVDTHLPDELETL